MFRDEGLRNLVKVIVQLCGSSLDEKKSVSLTQQEDIKRKFLSLDSADTSIHHFIVNNRQTLIRHINHTDHLAFLHAKAK
ncbi:hypothetical protein [Parageobacillus thermoglucosidasius]|uniref:hypothetical protein n=1 Tax=Parageobacillus thermoglucosidasius TaxID=1426 RepID=UPI0030C6C51A